MQIVAEVAARQMLWVAEVVKTEVIKTSSRLSGISFGVETLVEFHYQY